jgi:hypothetical protein
MRRIVSQALSVTYHNEHETERQPYGRFRVNDAVRKLA